MIREAIQHLVDGQSLTEEQASQVMGEIMAGEATPAQLGALLVALRLKGETVDEIAGFARVMRSKALPVPVNGDDLIDTCGTGGDDSGTFNISTGSALVAAAAGLKVAKHGNRSVTSRCGSADVLEALGVKVDLGPEGVARCIDQAGMGFMFALAFHPAMRYAAGPRREIGIRTVFNILGPLTNPAHARAQVLGVADPALVEKMAQVLKRLGARHALVVHGQDGVDELSLDGANLVAELKDGVVKTYEVRAEEFGLPRAAKDALAGGDANHNAALLRQLFAGESGPRRDAILLNAGAALLVGGKAKDLAEGIKKAASVLDSGEAARTLEKLVRVSQAAADIRN